MLAPPPLATPPRATPVDLAALSDILDSPPFRSAEEAWFWTMATLMARRDGASIAWRPDGLTRPCDPEDILKSLDTLYRERRIELIHARILRIWGERQTAPRADRALQRSDARIWQQAMGELEWALRARSIVR